MRRACSLLLALLACAPPRPPASPPAHEPDSTARRDAERREKLARYTESFARHGRPDRGWTPPPPPPGTITHAELMAYGVHLIELFNTVSTTPEEYEAEFLLEIAVVFLRAEHLAADPGAGFLALAHAIRVLKYQLEHYPQTPWSPAATVLLGAARWRLGFRDDEAMQSFEAATRSYPDHVCTQLAWIALGDRQCRRGDVDGADADFARAQQGPNPVAAELAAARVGCRNLDAPLGPGFFLEYRGPRRMRDKLCR